MVNTVTCMLKNFNKNSGLKDKKIEREKKKFQNFKCHVAKANKTQEEKITVTIKKVFRIGCASAVHSTRSMRTRCQKSKRDIWDGK